MKILLSIPSNVIFSYWKECPAVCCDGKCPSGYCHKCGENVGAILHHGQKISSMEECANICTEHGKCHSFNWSPIYKGGWCSTNTNSEYIKEQIGDFILCFKSQFCSEDSKGSIKSLQIIYIYMIL